MNALNTIKALTCYFILATGIFLEASTLFKVLQVMNFGAFSFLILSLQFKCKGAEVIGTIFTLLSVLIFMLICLNN